MAAVDVASKEREIKVTKTICPKCVNGRGQYLDIKGHNRRHHGGRTPKAGK